MLSDEQLLSGSFLSLTNPEALSCASWMIFARSWNHRMPWVGMYFCSCFVCLWLSLAPKRPDIIYLSEMDCCIEKPTNKQTRSVSVRRNLSYPHFSLLYPNIKMKVVTQCDKFHNMRRHKAHLAYCCNLKFFGVHLPPNYGHKQWSGTWLMKSPRNCWHL